MTGSTCVEAAPATVTGWEHSLFVRTPCSVGLAASAAETRRTLGSSPRRTDANLGRLGSALPRVIAWWSDRTPCRS